MVSNGYFVKRTTAPKAALHLGCFAIQQPPTKGCTTRGCPLSHRKPELLHNSIRCKCAILYYFQGCFAGERTQNERSVNVAQRKRTISAVPPVILFIFLLEQTPSGPGTEREKENERESSSASSLCTLQCAVHCAPSPLALHVLSLFLERTMTPSECSLTLCPVRHPLCHSVSLEVDKGSSEP